MHEWRDGSEAQKEKNEEALVNLKTRFPSLPKNVLVGVYKCRLERMKVLTCVGLPEDMRWLIEARVHLTGELHHQSQ